MRSGLLRHRGTIERAIDAEDSTGAPYVAWAPLLERISCHVLPADAPGGMSGQERVQAGPQVQAEIDTKVRIRYRPGIAEKMRFRHHVGGAGSPTQDDLYEIQAVTPADPKRRELWLWCKRRHNPGFRGGTP